MKKTLSLLTALCGLLLSSCMENEDGPIVPIDPVQTSCYVVNQGNFYSNISGSLSVLSDGAGSREILNDGQLGDTPENAVRLGRYLYVPCNSSNILAVVDAEFGHVVHRIPLESPQYVCTDDNYIYVTLSAGYLARIHPVSYAVDTLSVGPSPYGCAYTQGQIYVCLSPWSEDWTQPLGRSLAVVDTHKFVKTGEIGVGLNPYDQITVDANGMVYVVCCGNYADIPSEVWQVSPEGRSCRLCPGTIVAASPTQPLLYVIDSVTDYSNYPEVSTKTSYSLYDFGRSPAELTELPIEDEIAPPAPVAAFVSPYDGSLFITSDAGVSDYTSPGFVYQYSGSGSFKTFTSVGVHPYYIAF